MRHSNKRPNTESKTVSTTNEGETTYSILDGESVTETVIHAVSAETECDPRELESLYSVVEPDALNALFTPRMNGSQRMTNAMVTFTYNGCRVRVTANKEVEITESVFGKDVPA